MNCYRCLVVAILLSGSSAASNAQTLPSYMAPIAGRTSAAPSDIATKDVLALNTGMFDSRYAKGSRRAGRCLGKNRSGLSRGISASASD
jgi:hypothetical protein